LRNAAPEEFDVFRRQFDQYMHAIVYAVPDAVPGAEIERAAGAAASIIQVSDILHKCDREPKRTEEPPA
jgi:hypothetical protein